MLLLLKKIDEKSKHDYMDLNKYDLFDKCELIKNRFDRRMSGTTKTMRAKNK